jgi:hypothetical protein
MNAYTWATEFRALFDRCAEKHRSGNTDFGSWLDLNDVEFLKSIGCKPREFFDFVDDYCRSNGDEPSADTALLVAAVRRDYFLVVQKGVPSTKTIKPSELPPKPAELEGIPWLPRFIAKAEAKLRGEMDPDTMFGCGGDLAFCSRHHLHLADFLRVVWAARGDEAKVLGFVKTGKFV